MDPRERPKLDKLWHSESLPTDWSLSKYIPVIKPGALPTIASSYRLIDLTSKLSLQDNGKIS